MREPAIIPRVIPCLLVEDEVMVKTVRYANPTYLGDPINVINLFNRFEVDEICLLDIGATREGAEPPYELIGQLAAECWVPLAYGGGLRTLDQVTRVLSSGIEKVVLGTIVADDASLVTRAAEVYGSQAIIVSVDAVPAGVGHEVAVTSATRRLGVDPVTYGVRAQELGAGEILLNAVDRDGTMLGYDVELIRSVASAVRVPVIACGGAGERTHLADAIRRGGAAAVAAGSIFVYRGRERGVLINFPERELLEAMLG